MLPLLPMLLMCVQILGPVLVNALPFKYFKINFQFDVGRGPRKVLPQICRPQGQGPEYWGMPAFSLKQRVPEQFYGRCLKARGYGPPILASKFPREMSMCMSTAQARTQ